MLLEILTIIFVATFIRSALGFGEALVAVPLLALIIPIEVAAPVAVLISITVSVFSVAQDWHHIHIRSAGWLFASTLLGIPLGLWLLSSASAETVKTVLAIVIIAFSTYLLLNRHSITLKSDKFSPIFGFLAGALGGAYGMNGPPLVAYGALRRWSPQHFRATLQGYFLPASAVVMAGYWIAGFWTSEVTHYYLLSLPVVVVSIFAGRLANRYFNEHTFFVCVHCALIIVGAALLWQAYA